MKTVIKKIARNFGLEIKRYTPKLMEKELISLDPETVPQGYVLLSYIIEPFLLKGDDPIPNTHTHFWESFQIANTFLELGYGVDVIRWTNNKFVPEKKYAFFIDARRNLERLAHQLNTDCVKIMHIDTAHILFHNAAEAQRLLDLQHRRGVTLIPRRFEIPNLGIEHADCGVIYGNEFAVGTFSYANKPIYQIPISSGVLFPWSEQKDFEACRRRFLWFGSGGLVHKGLDLVIDAFIEMEDYHLTICGPIDNEKDFEQAYYKELYQTSNIHTVGWIDISSPEFVELTNSCVGLIYPSCSEGQSGSTVTCLHAGLIPILSFESGVDVEDFGVILKNCSIEEIQRSVQRISELPSRELKTMSRKAWEYARAHHTRENFAREYRRVILEIIRNFGSR